MMGRQRQGKNKKIKSSNSCLYFLAVSTVLYGIGLFIWLPIQNIIPHNAHPGLVLLDTSTTAQTESIFSVKEEHVNKEDVRIELSGFEINIENDDTNIDEWPKLRAYTEPLVNYYINNTGRFGSNAKRKEKKKEDVGEPPQPIVPMPQRTLQTLQTFTYGSTSTCNDNIPALLPTNADADEFPNVNNKNVLSEYPNKEFMGQHCPVDVDPFLPWIHDVFPNANGTVLHFIAQNKRRCNTGERFESDIKFYEAQVALMQPISVKRIYTSGQKLPRYRLASREDADEDGQETRFICRFHTISENKKVILGETLSTYPINYEYVHSRKSAAAGMITPHGKDNPYFWLSNFRFDCPIPDNGKLQSSIATGSSLLQYQKSPNNKEPVVLLPTIFADIIPIRTSVRFFPELYVKPEMYRNNDVPTKKNGHSYSLPPFDPNVKFGKNHVLPLVEESGRWANIPICSPHKPTKEILTNTKTTIDTATNEQQKYTEKKHVLVACLWASEKFATRGNMRSVSDTSERLKEWIEFHLLVGFDHIYVYDNSAAHNTTTSLQPITSLFEQSEVTRIDWPSRVCNNNPPAHENTGERSSQYAAESSCRQRYGPHTEWLASFDTDEYLIPMGKHESLKTVVEEASKEGTKVLSFKSTRAMINRDFTDEYYDRSECGNEGDAKCVKKKDDALYVETYNCDVTQFPKPDWAQRAKKQIYRPDFVLSHFVHYSTITEGILESPAQNPSWNLRYKENSLTERFTRELDEAVMLHTKTTVPGDTRKWFDWCKFGFKGNHRQQCRVGFPYPSSTNTGETSTEDGYAHNCYTNSRLTNIFIPKLKQAMKIRQEKIQNKHD